MEEDTDEHGPGRLGEAGEKKKRGDSTPGAARSAPGAARSATVGPVAFPACAGSPPAADSRCGGFFFFFSPSQAARSVMLLMVRVSPCSSVTVRESRSKTNGPPLLFSFLLFSSLLFSSAGRRSKAKKKQSKEEAKQRRSKAKKKQSKEEEAARSSSNGSHGRTRTVTDMEEDTDEHGPGRLGEAEEKKKRGDSAPGAARSATVGPVAFPAFGGFPLWRFPA